MNKLNGIVRSNTSNPKWEKRDRFILSKGHGCLALYSILADKNYFSKDEFNNFCKPTSILGGHPERDKTPGVEASTGALGHGLPMAVGMALAAKIKKHNNRLCHLAFSYHLGSFLICLNQSVHR